MLKFYDHEDFIEIDLAGQEVTELPSKTDAYLRIRVSSGGFTGQNEVWVFGSVLRSFCQGLIALERNRKGEAEVESISPDELRLVVRSIDNRGHMQIKGTTAYEVQRENSNVWHSVEFGFEFDPSQLLGAINVEWVKRNAD